MASKYQWHSSNSNIKWNESGLYNNINGSDFYNNLGDCQNKVKEHDWPNGNISDGNKTASALCLEENNLSKIKAYIGLMTLSDYNYAYNGSESNCYGNFYGTSWLKIFNNGNEQSDPYYETEWTMVFWEWFVSIRSYSAYLAGAESGSLSAYSTQSSYAVRPVFYLDSSALIKSETGNGTSTDPFIIEKPQLEKENS